MKKFILYTDNLFSDAYISKTAHCVIRFLPDRVAGILDNGATLSTNDVEINKLIKKYSIPIFTTKESVCDTFLNDQIEIIIGFAPIGGKLDYNQITVIDFFCKRKYHIINGLHDYIDSVFVDNVRHRKFVSEIARNVHYKCKTILTVGTDHSIGKMTTSILLYNFLQSHGIDIDWLPTGQTGAIIKGSGSVLDSIPIDFVPGVIQSEILAYNNDYLIIEGQGSIFFPAYSPTSFALFHTSMPLYVVLCHDANRKRGHFGNQLPTVIDAKKFYEDLSHSLGFDSKVICIALNASTLSKKEYEEYKQTIIEETGLPCYDFVREEPINILPLFQVIDS